MVIRTTMQEQVLIISDWGSGEELIEVNALSNNARDNKK